MKPKNVLLISSHGRLDSKGLYGLGMGDRD